MKSLLLLFATLLPALLRAQTPGNWFEETMYASGKINVVVAVVLVILLGLFGYLIWLDRRLRKIEEEQAND